MKALSVLVNHLFCYYIITGLIEGVPTNTAAVTNHPSVYTVVSRIYAPPFATLMLVESVGGGLICGI